MPYAFEAERTAAVAGSSFNRAPVKHTRNVERHLLASRGVVSLTSTDRLGAGFRVAGDPELRVGDASLRHDCRPPHANPARSANGPRSAHRSDRSCSPDRDARKGRWTPSRRRRSPTPSAGHYGAASSRGEVAASGDVPVDLRGHAGIDNVPAAAQGHVEGIGGVHPRLARTIAAHGGVPRSQT